MRFIFIFLTVSLIFAVGCEYHSPNTKNHTLISGKQLTNYQEDKLEIPGSDKHTLLVFYQTEIPVENKESLRKEIEEILATLQADKSKKDLKTGAVVAHHWETYGFFRRLKHTKEYFSFYRDNDGKFRLKEKNSGS